MKKETTESDFKVKKDMSAFYKQQEKEWETDVYRIYSRRKFALFKKYIFGKVLDVGCGVGYFYNWYPKKENMTNFDFVDRGLPNFCSGDIADLPFEDKSFDTVICSDVIEHLEHHIHLKAVDEIFRVAKKRVIISSCFASWYTRKITDSIRRLIGVKEHDMWNHWREYDKKEFNQLMEKYGTIIDTFDISLPFFSMFISRFAMHRKVLWTKMYIVDKK
ncbi:MAG: class I SAM-dependent methyltransferase [Candidatus Helarchaeota archaeon]|nr:class I SAM-dependent methyltransferase [Candidatus Helarchaeota archaeon]